MTPQQHAEQGVAGVDHQRNGHQGAEQVGVAPVQVQLVVGHEHDGAADRREHARHRKAEELPGIAAQAQRQARFKKHVAIEKDQQAHAEDDCPDHHACPQ